MDFERQIESLLSVQASHDARIQALIRVAELQQANLERLDEEWRELRESQRAEDERIREEMRERGRVLDERIATLVSAIGEFLRRAGNS